MGLKESYTSDIDSTSVTSLNTYGSIYSSQTFTAEDTSDRTSAKALLFRTGSPGDITYEIQDTTTGRPNGSVLATGTLNGNSITTDTAGEYFEITFDTPYEVSVGTVYALVVKASSGDASNKVQWRADLTSPAYAGGSRVWTSNGGSTWTIDTAKDMGFELYGGVTYDLDVTIVSTSALSASAVLGQVESCTIAATSTLTFNPTVTQTSTAVPNTELQYVSVLIAINNDRVYYETSV